MPESIIKRKSLVKFPGVMLDAYLEETSLKTICFSYIHSYLNYANIAWASTRISKVKPLLYKQKQAARIIFNEGHLSHSKPLFKILNFLNVYKIKLYQHLNFIYRLENSDILAIFNDFVKKPEHKLLTNFRA